ncbi:MAG: HAMP domain-containing histidine kinase [Deltaproteobacteria bacterium]|nr:HAMP domain-containing histidine kinase [Deltaproteobacteria bacterium]
MIKSGINDKNETDKYKKALVKAESDLSLMKAELEQKTRELTEANDELKSLDRMKNEFIQSISHELRTPLTPVVGYVELFLNNDLGDLSPSQREIMVDIHKCSRQLAFNIDSLLHMVALQDEVGNENYEEIEINSIIEYVAYYIREDAESNGLSFKVSCEAKLDPVWGVRGMLILMLNHILKNAIKFTSKDGHIAMLTESKGNGFIDIIIKDTGVGIDSLRISRIFEPFFQRDCTATSGYEGIGLGLALVKKIVELHKGSISVKSREGKGTTFRVSLPVVANL